MKSICKVGTLRDANLGGNVDGDGGGGQPNDGLLLSIGTDEGVHTLGLHVVQLLERITDLGLGGTHVDNKGERVVGLHDLVGSLRVQRVSDNLVPVHRLGILNRATKHNGLLGQTEGTGAAEGRVLVDLGSGLVRLLTLEEVELALSLADNFAVYGNAKGRRERRSRMKQGRGARERGEGRREEEKAAQHSTAQQHSSSTGGG